MTRERLAQCVAAVALCRGKNLADALEAALAQGGVDPRERAVISAVKDGRLRAALPQLGFSPLCGHALALAQNAALAVDARLRDLPTELDLSWRLRTVLFYLSAVMWVQAAVGGTILAYLAPVFASMHAPAAFMPQLVWWLPLLWTLAALTLIYCAAGAPGSSILLWKASRLLGAARVATVAAAMLDHGAPKANIAELISEHDPQGLLAGLPVGPAAAEARALDSLAAFLVEEARNRLDAATRRWKIGGTVACLLMALLLSSWIYVPLFQLGGALA